MSSRRDLSAFGLKGAGRLLEPEAAAARLRATLFARDPAAETLRAVPVYARLKPATMLVVAWRVEIGAASQRRVDHAHAILGPGGLAKREAAKWVRLHPKIEPRADHLHVDPGADTVLARFPFDLGLKRLDAIALPARIKRLCEELDDPFGDGLATAVRERGSEARLLSWRPRRRAVVEWDLRARAGEGFVRRRAVVRLLADPPPAGVEWRRGAGGDFLPRLFSASRDATLLVEERLAGAPLDEGARPAAAQLRKLGRLVGHFHESTRTRSGAVKSRAVAWTALVERAADSMRDVAALAPELAAAADAALTALGCCAAPHATSPPQIVHGDLHLGQVLWRDGAPALCDLDRAELAPCELDLGRLHADLVARGCDRDDALFALCEGYSGSDAGRIAPELVRPFTAASLLIAAGEPLRRIAADASAQTARRIDHARALLSSARSIGAFH